MNEIFKELAHLNVLLVEDDTQLQGVLAGLLAPYVSQIYKAQNGQDGFECFSKNDIDIIITDINMTQMSGTTMAKRVRELDERVPIIFITAYDTDENLQNSLNIQNSNLLKKPFDKQQLLIMILMATKNSSNANKRLNLGRGFSYDTQDRLLYNENKNIVLTRTEQ